MKLLTGLRRALGRSYKLVIPVLIGVVIVIATFAAHIAQSVDVTDHDYLNPGSAAPLGGRTLATALAADGVQVVRMTSDVDAFRAVSAAAVPVTLFIPSLEMMRPDVIAALRSAPAGTRIVIVAPGEIRLIEGELPFVALGSRWAPRRASPRCNLPDAVRAGRATVDGVEYAGEIPPAYVCYGGGLMEIDEAGLAETVVGASDPFRNDRIGEGGNQALAVGLLSHTSSVIWLDIHAVRPGAKPAADDGPPPDMETKPLADLLPSWVWAGIGLLLLAGVMLALASGRRLGGPVTEPLPVAARINETIEGRGRLYRRARDRRSVLKILQAAAIERIRVVAGLPSGAAAADIVAATSAYLEIPAADINRILYGPAPENDEDLLYAVASLDAITEFATPPPPSEPAGFGADGGHTDHNNEGVS
jgi:hypothetical protein